MEIEGHLSMVLHCFRQNLLNGMRQFQGAGWNTMDTVMKCVGKSTISKTWPASLYHFQLWFLWLVLDRTGLVWRGLSGLVPCASRAQRMNCPSYDALDDSLTGCRLNKYNGRYSLKITLQCACSVEYWYSTASSGICYVLFYSRSKIKETVFTHPFPPLRIQDKFFNNSVGKFPLWNERFYLRAVCSRQDDRVPVN